jgi:hypothetical protein
MEDFLTELWKLGYASVRVEPASASGFAHEYANLVVITAHPDVSPRLSAFPPVVQLLMDRGQLFGGSALALEVVQS